MHMNIVIVFSIFALSLICMFYLFRFFVRKSIAKHTAGKLDLMYKIYVICGCFVIISSLFMLAKTKNFVNHAKLIPAEVVQLIGSQWTPSDEDLTCFKPVFSYRNAKNMEVHLTSKTCAHPPKFSIGDKVDLLLNEANPNDDPIENEWSALWGGSSILLGLGVLFSLLGSLGIFMRHRQNKRKSSALNKRKTQ